MSAGPRLRLRCDTCGDRSRLSDTVTKKYLDTGYPYRCKTCRGVDAAMRPVSKDELAAYWRENFTQADIDRIFGGLLLDEHDGLARTNPGGPSAGEAERSLTT